MMLPICPEPLAYNCVNRVFHPDELSEGAPMTLIAEEAGVATSALVAEEDGVAGSDLLSDP